VAVALAAGAVAAASTPCIVATWSKATTDTASRRLPCVHRSASLPHRHVIMVRLRGTVLLVLVLVLVLGVVGVVLVPAVWAAACLNTAALAAHSRPNCTRMVTYAPNCPRLCQPFPWVVNGSWTWDSAWQAGRHLLLRVAPVAVVVASPRLRPVVVALRCAGDCDHLRQGTVLPPPHLPLPVALQPPTSPPCSRPPP